VIEKKIEKARRLHARWAEDRSLQEATAEGIEEYRRAIASTSREMDRAGVIGACTSCAAGPGGSCCFYGVEDWYDDVLLLINLLLGVSPPERREVSDGCFFVGEKGCRLLARHAFCVNYICPPLDKSLDRVERNRLFAVSGRELLCGWELEKTLRLWAKSGEDEG